MEQTSTTDSNYGSARTAEQSSMSSFSLGSSEVATGMHSKGSTSGCSSGISYNSQNRKDKKKEAIKKCLQELKSLMPQQGKTKAGTVSTLKTVLHHMKKIKGEETGGAGADIELLSSMPEGECSNLEFPFSPDLDRTQDSFKIVMSVKECLVLQVSPDILEMLGYPKNYWFNQCLTDYVYKRDVVTISSNLSVARGQTKSQHTTASTSGAEGSSGEELEERKTMFFFRLRHYKSLRQGFSLNRSDKYSVFCGRAKVQKVKLSFPPGTPAEGLQSDSMYLVLECMPLHSAYTRPHSLPEKRSFSTRHTIYCNYNFIHPMTLPLLGFLPQDMIGTSIFEYHHPQDLQLLLNIYQQVIQMPGQTFRSPPYRIRAKNGDYIIVETEWSSFVNPWTKRFDFIMGQHEVVQGPLNPDVFGQTFLSRKPVEVNYEHRQIHKKIKSLLLQTIATLPRSSSKTSLEPIPSTSRLQMSTATSAVYRLDISSSDLIEKSTKRQAEETQTKEEASKMVSGSGWKKDPSFTMAHQPYKNTMEYANLYKHLTGFNLRGVNDRTSQEEEERASPTQSVGTNSSLLTLSEEEKALIYERLNYAQNILRFLNSCHVGEGLEDVGQKQGSPFAKAEGSESSDEEGLTVEVDIPKPPSCASSTKALVSDQEAREEVMPPSPAQEEVPEYSSQRETGPADDVYEPISLTEDVLKMHNLLQEQYYLQKMTKEKEGFKSILQEGKSRKKRLLNDDAGHKKATKFLRQEDGQASARHPKVFTSSLSPPFPMTKLERTTTAPAAPNQMGQNTRMQGTGTSSMTMPNVPSHFMSYTPLIQMPVPVNNSSSSMAQSGLQWPFYHPQAVSIMQPFFYQPIMPQPLTGQSVVNQGLLDLGRAPMSNATATSTSMASQSTAKTPSATPCLTASQKESMKTGETNKEQEVSDTLSFGDTGSSILYLLESNSGSQNNSSNSDVDQSEEDKIKKKKLLPAAPPWVAAVNWSDDVAMRYRMPSMVLAKTLKEDRAVLKKHKQHNAVIMQMQELMNQIEERSQEEDSDLLFIAEEGHSIKVPHESITCLEDESSGEIKSAAPSAGLEENMEENMEKNDRGSPTSIEMETHEQEEGTEEKNKEVAEERHDKMDMSPVSGEGSPKECSSLDKLSHDSDSACSDSGSKGSSELTPSDQRSHEEVVSSVKESDNASCESGSSKEKNINTADEFERQQLSHKLTHGMFMKLFVPVKIDYFSWPMQEPTWVQEANFSSSIQMTYRKDNPDINSTLKEDKKTLDYCQQPDLVKEQLNELMLSLSSDDKNEDSLCSGGEGVKEAPGSETVTSPEESTQQAAEMNSGCNRDTDIKMTDAEVQQEVEAMQDSEQSSQTGSSVTGRSVTEGSMTSKLSEDNGITTAVKKMEIENKPQTSSSDDDNFRLPILHHRRSRKSRMLSQRFIVRPCSSSSSGCSPNPCVKLEKPDTPQSSTPDVGSHSGESVDQPSGGDSDTWEQLRRAVKSSMTAMFEGQEGSSEGLHSDKKDSQGHSVITSSEKSSEASAFASQPSTVEDLMKQLFQSNEAMDTLDMD